ncbi:MAG: hypothetical protein HY377_01185 [Candidatus Blackburnbacteria bacterium]|nr:hypothetical protein [Candidatus Blackburnbacteria bacterium]
MTKVSKKVLDKDIEERMFEIFWEGVAGIKSPQEARKFLNSLISDIEHTMLAKRLGIALMLTKGFSYQEIENTLKVSSATIMSVGVRHKIGEGGLSPALKRIMRDEKVQDFWDNIDEWLIMLAPPAKFGSFRQEKRIKAGRRIYKSRKKRTAL